MLVTGQRGHPRNRDTHRIYSMNQTLHRPLLLRALAFLAFTVRFTLSLEAGELKLAGRTFKVPEGFTIERVAGPPLVDRPITAAFDDGGRLYVSDSSGSNDNVKKQLAEKPHRIVRLEDTNDDGTFDKRVVFADKMMFPEGTMWYGGSLYVAAPPSIWKLTDTDGDGVADQRVEWFAGKTLTGCANDLHGPYLGPRRLDLLVQGGVCPADLRAARPAAIRDQGSSHLPLPARRQRYRAGHDRRHG